MRGFTLHHLFFSQEFEGKSHMAALQASAGYFGVCLLELIVCFICERASNFAAVDRHRLSEPSPRYRRRQPSKLSSLDSVALLFSSRSHFLRAMHVILALGSLPGAISGLLMQVTDPESSSTLPLMFEVQWCWLYPPFLEDRNWKWRWPSQWCCGQFGLINNSVSRVRLSC